MRKFIITLVAVIATIFTSCSNEQASLITPSNSNEIVENAKIESLSVLQGKITMLNDSMGITPKETRGFFSRLWKVICSDAVGGLFGNLWGGPAGAVVGAAACSGAVSISVATRSTNISEYEMNPDLNNLVPTPENGETPSFEDSIGYYHNKSLISLQSSNKPISIRDMPILLMDEVKNEIPQNTTFTDNDSIQLNKTYQEFISNEQKYAGNDIDSYEKHLISCYPNQKGEIQVICEFLKGITNIDAEDIDSYSTKVLNLIDLSQLSGTVRQNLRNGVIVGKASKKLWKLTPIDQLPVKEER